MDILLYFGIGAGVFLYAGKLYVYTLLMKPFPKMNNWIHSSPLMLVVLDTLFGFAGMHIVMIAGGSVTAMFAMVAFGTCSALYLLYCNIRYGEKPAKRRATC